jgi:ABC-2 type transport system ATP-binding protein
LVQDGTDVLLTTQYLDEADHLANHVVIVDRGRAVAAGTPAELKRLIGVSVIEVHVRAADALERVADLLRRLDRSAVVEIDPPTRRVSVRIDPGSEGLMNAIQSVYGAGVDIDDIAVRQPNLDEVFLALTGKPVRDSQAAGAKAA